MKIIRPDFDKRNGIIPVIVQDVNSGIVLMLAYTNEDCFIETVQTGDAIYYSISRNRRWKTGETSGNTQKVRYMLIDCDSDALIYKVEQSGGGACHTGAASCFFSTIGGNQWYSGAKNESSPKRTLIEIPTIKLGWFVVDQASI